VFRGLLNRLLLVVYLIVGVVVASNRDYFRHLHAVRPVLSAALAVALWPLVVGGASLHLH
jgi:hypothetical protein